MTIWRNRTSGYTLPEMIIAVGVVSLMFAFLAYLTFFTGRNFVGIHEQVLSQNSAAMASERVANLFRNGIYFKHFAGDSATSTTSRRMMVAIPGANDAVTTWCVAYDPGNKQVLIFDSVQGLSFSSNGAPSGRTPTATFEHIEDMTIRYETEYRLSLDFEFTYSGFARILANPGNPQYGQFITDVIAKNHYMDQGADSYEDPTTSGPATL